MQKTVLLGSVGSLLVLVACAAGQDEGSAASRAADTTNAPATATTNTGRTSTRTGTTNRGTTNVATTNADGGTALGCYAGRGTCEPTNPDACGKGETCDINGGSGAFECFPPPNDAKLGEACDNSQGPFCGQGLACDQGTCKTYCCDDSVCAAGTTCTETGSVGEITIKVCQ